ncbi:MAG: hypothetical protein AUI15_29385 [Actinobacteria bacterium 13_2_20CM_2_66_6]|nr:MAG: hypothetical protein AUI15_29385 [Actinobacteria bacterium 13_2_20CM_2_66_6]
MSNRVAAPPRSLFARLRLRERIRDRDTAIYGLLLLVALVFPAISLYTSDGSTYLIAVAGHAGTYVLLAIGLNVVVGFAGLLDLGYAAFFAIGAYTYALFASQQLLASPIHHAYHFPFWLMMFVGLIIAASAGAILGFPTLRLRGDYLAIVTLGFGEIVPQVFQNFDQWTGGINAIGGIDQPTLPAWVTGPWAGADSISIVAPFSFSFDPIAYYVLIFILVSVAIVLVNNLQRSRLGRAWMAIRDLFIVSITVLVMIVLGGMGSIPGVIVGAITVYFILNWFLPLLPPAVQSLASSIGLGSLNARSGDWPGLGNETQNVTLLLFGLILVSMMLVRPQGLFPSRVREQELKHATGQEDEAAIEQAHA